MAKTTKKPRNKQTKKNTDPKKAKKKQHKVINWREYNEALRQRGALDVWIDESVVDKWYADPNGKRGAQPIYSDIAITLTLQFGKVFSQKLRQTEGLMQSVLNLMGLDLSVPDFSTLSRRGATAIVSLPKDIRETLVLIADSSGLKVYGEGEWKVKKHGIGKHRTWRKIHLAVTPDGEIRGIELTTNASTDSDATSDLLDQEEGDIAVFAGDGAYDRRKVYNLCRERHIQRVLIPPQKNAKIWQHGNSKAPPHPRDANLRAIRKTSRKHWKEASGYHVRSLAETAVFRFKTIFGDRLDARNLEQQATEVRIKAAVLNRMWKLGMPQTVAIG